LTILFLISKERRKGKKVMTTLRIPLERITLDEIAQPRVAIDDGYIEELANDLLTGSKFPPVAVFSHGEDYRLADGFHRFLATIKAGFKEITAEIYLGDQRAAILHAVGANAAHGKRRTNDDKRKAVETILKDDEWCKWSDRKIAEVCRVSQPFVGTIRKEMTENGYKFPEKRISSNGRQINTTNIGSNRTQNPVQTEAPVDETSENVQQTAGTDDAQAPTVRHPATDHPAEESPPAETPDTETNQVEAPESDTESQSEPTDASNPDAEHRPEGITPPAETEVNAVENEASETAPAVVNPIEEDEASPQGPETDTPQVEDDVQTLKAKVTELRESLQAKELEIQEKDRFIEDLEAKIWFLENEIADYKEELENYEREEHAREQVNKDMVMAEEAAV
jgi:hypothetical protein